MRSRQARRLGTALVAALLGTACAGVPQSGTAQDTPNARADALFQEFESPGSPGATVAVVRDGEIIHTGAYGLADVGTGRELTPSTPIRLGSLGKQFTAMAIMMLAERGRLSYDDPITQWLPEVARFGDISVRNLLTHTSGLPDYYDRLGEVHEEIATADGDPLLTSADAVTIWTDWGEAVFPTGDRFQYSNPGYEALALIAERASGESLASFLRVNVFEPLGMTESFVRDRPDVPARSRAIGYRPSNGDWQENDDHPFNWMVGAGGVYASVLDLVLWDQALYTDDLVYPATLEEAFREMPLNDGTRSSYGFGWGLNDRLGHRAVAHTGGWVGFRTSIIRFLDQRLTVIVLSNASAEANTLAEDVARIYLSDVLVGQGR